MVAGQLASRRLDGDALLAVAAEAAPSAPATAPANPAVVPATPPPPDPPRPAASRRAIPDLPLPFDQLGALDANLRWNVGELAVRGAAWRDVSLWLVIEDGRARLDPFVATLPGGRIALRLAADATTEPPTIQLAARSEGLDLGVLLPTLGLRPPLGGPLEIDADLRGQGRNLRAVAGTLYGHLGLAMVGGHLDRRLTELVPADFRRFLIPGPLQGQDIPLRCLALRANAEGGVARSQALLLDGALGRVGGIGAVNLRDEQLRLRLLPDIRTARFNLRAPVAIGGTLLQPRWGVDPAGAAAGGLEAFLSFQTTPDRSLQALAGALGAAAQAGEMPGCGPQLALARGGRAGAEPAPESAPEPQATPEPAPAIPGVPRQLQGPAQDLLRGLFGRQR
ncbi:AsmA-like C-terminal region-containing protein [Roseomonas sp. NAR14]|uniref:AsmA-like C-terminal region-containing protein n=2 Tax=Roseomonas acroporae TaxID=2937791 RepID=A0A9X2BYZ9_9PROT|nr:AsmA-like C-terminal region-containing protein [Roseomonas acroporae]